MKKVAVIGFGCAGYSAALALRQASADTLIDIYSDTDEAPYNPMLTTYYVSGKIAEDAMFPLGSLDEVTDRLKASVFCSSPVERLLARERRVLLADGTARSYDDIVIATGASAVVPPIGTLPESGVYTLRTAADARRLEKALRSDIKRAVVVGAQMVGIKAAELLHRRGIATVLADMEEQVFPASAYEATAAIISRRLEAAGIFLKLGSAVSAVRGSGAELSVEFADGSSIPCGLVVFCSGIKPNIPFVDRGELEVGLGIKTDSHMRASVPHIYAAGDCCEAPNILGGGSAYIGLWANSATQGRTAGQNIAGIPAEYGGSLIHNITHYMDTDFISVGDVRAAGERVVWEKPGLWRMEATVADGRMRALNILDNASLSGPAKNILLHQAARPGEGLSAAAKLILSRGGVPADIIAKIGGGEE